MHLNRPRCQQRLGLKVVCDECGNLSIKPIDPANASDLENVYCRRCNAVRGTVADLRELARQSADVFEF